MLQFISVHIQKTGGSSLRHFYSEMLGADRVVMDYTYDERTPLPVAPEVVLVHGHFSPQKYLRTAPDGSVLTWLRDPARRLYSHYHAIRANADKLSQQPDAPDHVRIVIEGRASFLDFAAHPEVRNIVSYYYFASFPIERCAFIGIFEHLDEDMELLCAVLGVPAQKLPKLNATKEMYEGARRRKGLAEVEEGGYVPPGEQDLQRARELNGEDYRLYQRALSLRAQRLQIPPA